MLTRARYKQGEGTLNTFNLEFGHASERNNMEKVDKCDKQEKNSHGLLSHVINGRTNVWRLQKEDKGERE